MNLIRPPHAASLTPPTARMLQALMLQVENSCEALLKALLTLLKFCKRPWSVTVLNRPAHQEHAPVVEFVPSNGNL